MNVHVRRVAARHRAERIRSFCAAVLASLLFGLFLGHAHAQDAANVVTSCGTVPLQYAPGAARPMTVDINGNLCSTGNSLGPGSGNAGFVSNATPVTSSATGTTGAVVATIPAAAGKFSYLCGFYASGSTSTTQNATAVTVAGTISGSLNYLVQHPVAPALGAMSQTFGPCVPSSAVNTAITVTSAADAAGSNVDVTAWGFQQ